MLKIRTNLLFDEKSEVKNDIADLNENLLRDLTSNTAVEDTLLKSLLCMAKLFKVYCNDTGGNDMADCLKLAKELDNDLLLAHVYRYANFFTDFNKQEINGLLLKAQKIFTEHRIEDHAIYCENNMLINSFYTEHVKKREFDTLATKSINNVPGLVGLSIIYNNAGVANLYKGNHEDATVYFEKGLEYTRDRPVQKIGLMTNLILAKKHAGGHIEEDEIRNAMSFLFHNLNDTNLPFLAANYATNLMVIANEHHPNLVKEFSESYPYMAVLKSALKPNMLGYSSLHKQLTWFSKKTDILDFNILCNKVNLPSPPITSDVRSACIERNGYNPSIFNAWL